MARILLIPLTIAFGLACPHAAIAQQKSPQNETVASSDQKRLTVIHDGIRGYADSLGAYPPGTNPHHFDADKKPFLSWRVHILPYMGQKAVYDQFKLDQPWDSAANKRLLAKMPAEFKSKGVTKAGYTSILGFSGAHALFTGGMARRGNPFLDNASDTIVFVEAGPDKSVPWTKPEDLSWDEASPAKALGKLPATGFSTVLGDGLVKRLPATLPAEVLKACITVDGREQVSLTEFLAAAQKREEAGKDPLALIGLAIGEYPKTHRSFLPPGTAKEHFNDRGEPHLSWRVHILPYVDQQKLYEEFHLNEPWDSPHNKTLLDRMPPVYRTARVKTPGHTSLLGIVHRADGFLTGGTGRRLADVRDGFANTMCIIEVGPDKAVPWTKPAEYSFEETDPLGGIGKLSSKSFRCLLLDGTPRTFPLSLPKKTVAGMMTVGRADLDSATINSLRQGETDSK